MYTYNKFPFDFGGAAVLRLEKWRSAEPFLDRCSSSSSSSSSSSICAWMWFRWEYVLKHLLTQCFSLLNLCYLEKSHGAKQIETLLKRPLSFAKKVYFRYSSASFRYSYVQTASKVLGPGARTLHYMLLILIRMQILTHASTNTNRTLILYATNINTDADINSTKSLPRTDDDPPPPLGSLIWAH